MIELVYENLRTSSSASLEISDALEMVLDPSSPVIEITIEM